MDCGYAFRPDCVLNCLILKINCKYQNGILWLFLKIVIYLWIDL